jgi:hypothetical protein
MRDPIQWICAFSRLPHALTSPAMSAGGISATVKNWTL